MIECQYKQEICSICYLQYEVQQLSKNRPNQICYNCWYNHIKVALTRITYKTGNNIISPFEGGQTIDVCIGLNSLKFDHQNELQQWLFKKYTTFTPDIQKCPSETCDYVFIGENCRWGAKSNYVCPKCQLPLSITKNFTIKTVLGFIYFLLFANKCPKCQIPIEKISGCPHMTCPCGHQFCWYCLKDYRHKIDNIYTPHEPKQCAFILLSKFILFLMCIMGLLLTITGYQGFKNFVQILSIVFSIAIRAIILDFYIALQIFACVIMMSSRSTYYRRSFLHYVEKKKLIIVLVIINLLVLLLLYYLDQLTTSCCIFLTQLFIVGVIAGSIYLVIYSIQTWFEHIS